MFKKEIFLLGARENSKFELHFTQENKKAIIMTTSQDIAELKEQVKLILAQMQMLSSKPIDVSKKANISTNTVKITPEQMAVIKLMDWKDDGYHEQATKNGEIKLVRKAKGEVPASVWEARDKMGKDAFFKLGFSLSKYYGKWYLAHWINMGQ